MISRRDFLQASVAASSALSLSGLPSLAKASALQMLRQDQLLDFDTFGNVTLIHITDVHGQLKPVYFREPEINIGVGSVDGLPPHVTGKTFIDLFNLKPGSPQAYSLTHEDFTGLAKGYGKMGGIDRVATVIDSIRSSRPDALLFDGGDTWQGSYTSQMTAGMDMVNVFNQLKPDAMTSHWEFTLGIERVKEIVENHINFPFLGANIFDTEWDERAFEPYKFFERGGVKIAVIGQAFPYMPIANPSWMFPGLSFGIREQNLANLITEVREAGAELVVLLSHNGFDVDRQLAKNLTGLDVILTGHTHDAIPEPILVGKTMLIASGSNGKFVTRLDLEVNKSGVQGFKHRLIPIFSDVIEPSKKVRSVISKERFPFKKQLKEIIGHTNSLLYRRGNFNGTWDDLICQAIIEERDADIALSPGFRWGPSLLPGTAITREDIFNATAMSYPNVYLNAMTGENLKLILEDVADNLFNPDPYYQQGGDMVRVGGMGYKIDIKRKQGDRISDMVLLKTGNLIDPTKVYRVGGWASINKDTKGPPIWELLEKYIRKNSPITLDPNKSVKVINN